MQSALASNLLPFQPHPRREYLQALAARALAALDAQGLAIALQQGDDIVCIASVGVAPREGTKLDAGSVLSVRCMQTAAPVIASRPASSHAAEYSILLVPIVGDGKAIGLCAAFAARENAFTAEHTTSLGETARSVLESGAPQAVATVARPPVLDAQILETLKGQIADFARAEQRRIRITIATKIVIAIVLLCALGASLVPDRAANWVTQAVKRFEPPARPVPALPRDRTAR